MSEPGWTDAGRVWLADQPAAVREKCEAYPPWETYELTTTGQHCRIDSYSEAEDGSCDTCCVTAWYPYAPIPVGVFGIHFTDLRVLPPEDQEPTV